MAQLTVSHPHSANQPRQRTRIKDVADHAIGLALEEATFGTAGDDTTGILASVLEQREAFANLLRNIHRWIMGEEA